MGIRRSQADAFGPGRDRRTDVSGHDGAESSERGRQGFVTAYREFAKEVDLAALALDPVELFGNIRKEAMGRDVQL